MKTRLNTVTSQPLPDSQMDLAPLYEWPPGRLVIDAKGLSKRFGATLVLSDLSLEVGAGEIFGLIGPSGSGKTTTMHLCCGHLRPSAGTITVLGEVPTSFTSATRRRIGYMPQDYILYRDLSVEQNISFAAGLYGLSEWKHRDTIRAVLDLVELGPARRQVVRNVSGGMQRRVALAAALVHDPDVMFADEPTANLDPILRSKLWKHFRGMCERNRTLLITTQYIDEAEYCDRVGLMFDGALIAVGRPEALRRRAFGGDVVDMQVERTAGAYVDVLSDSPIVRAIDTPHADSLRITVDDAQRAIPMLLDILERAGGAIRSVGQYRPTFDEVFIRLIEQHGEPRPPVGRLQTSAAGDEQE